MHGKIPGHYPTWERPPQKLLPSYTSLFAILISSCEDSSEKSMEDKMPELNELNLSVSFDKRLSDNLQLTEKS